MSHLKNSENSCIQQKKHGSGMFMERLSCVETAFRKLTVILSCCLLPVTLIFSKAEHSTLNCEKTNIHDENKSDDVLQLSWCKRSFCEPKQARCQNKHPWNLKLCAKAYNSNLSLHVEKEQHPLALSRIPMNSLYTANTTQSYQKIPSDLQYIAFRVPKLLLTVLLSSL